MVVWMELPISETENEGQDMGWVSWRRKNSGLCLRPNDLKYKGHTSARVYKLVEIRSGLWEG